VSVLVRMTDALATAAPVGVGDASLDAAVPARLRVSDRGDAEDDKEGEPGRCPAGETGRGLVSTYRVPRKNRYAILRPLCANVEKGASGGVRTIFEVVLPMSNEMVRLWNILLLEYLELRGGFVGY